MVFPVFLFGMILTLQYCRVMETACGLSGKLAEAAETMSVAAYVYEYPEDVQGTVSGIAAAALSDAYVYSQAAAEADGQNTISGLSVLLSSYLQEEEMIHLVLTYKASLPFSFLSISPLSFVQKASVRAWTGREGSGAKGTEESEKANDDETIVYVTETGSVYHTDENCTYLKLSIHTTQLSAVSGLRNDNGEKYYSCELCNGDQGGIVFITDDGNRYHSSLICSGLKRTIHEVKKGDLGDMKLCSRCGQRGD